MPISGLESSSVVLPNMLLSSVVSILLKRRINILNRVVKVILVPDIGVPTLAILKGKVALAVFEVELIGVLVPLLVEKILVLVLDSLVDIFDLAIHF